MNTYEPIYQLAYGPMQEKVDLSPDFFSDFQPANRAEIVKREATFYREITEPYSVDDRLEISNISLNADDGYPITIQKYQKKDRNPHAAALVFFHGGGFKTCSVETHRFVPAYLAANAGVVAFSVEYRLAPECRFPRGLEDCYQAVRWISNESSRLGIDNHRLMLCGDSSGGNFVAAITMLARERNEFRIEKQALIYPALEFSGTVRKRSEEVYGQTIPDAGNKDTKYSPLMQEYLSCPEQEVRNPLVSPILANDFKGLPEALFILAECDIYVDDGLIYANQLQNAGVNVNCKVYEGMPHAFILRTYAETFEALDEICRFIRS